MGTGTDFLSDPYLVLKKTKQKTTLSFIILCRRRFHLKIVPNFMHTDISCLMCVFVCLTTPSDPSFLIVVEGSFPKYQCNP